MKFLLSSKMLCMICFLVYDDGSLYEALKKKLFIWTQFLKFSKFRDKYIQLITMCLIFMVSRVFNVDVNYCRL